MDPDVALAEIRAAIALAREGLEKGTPVGNALAFQHLSRAADAMEALDGWLSNGGFLPKVWSDIDVDHFAVTVHTENESFTEDPAAEIASILEAVGRLLQDGRTSGTCIDSNGNSVGEWRFRK